MILAKIKAWYKWGITVLLSLGGVWLYLKGRRDQKATYSHSQVKAIKEAKETRDEVQTADDQRLIDILTGRVRK